MVTIGSYNIQYGIGQDGRFDLARIVGVIADWDVIALQEVETRWDRSGDRDLVALLRDALPDHFFAWGPNIDILKKRDGRPAGPRESRRQFGNMTLSRFPIESIRNHYLPRFGAADYFDMQRGVLETNIAVPDGAIRVYNAHYCHITDRQRQLQIRRTHELMAEAVAEGPVLSGAHDREKSWSSETPVPAVPASIVLLGDFNCTPDSPAYAALAGEFEPRRGRLRRMGGLIDSWDAACAKGIKIGDGDPVGFTKYKDYRARQQGTRVDYCFMTEDLIARMTGARVIEDADGSDHLPLYVTLA